MTLIGLVILLIVLGLVWYALTLALGLLPIPEPIRTVILILLILIIAIAIWQYAGIGCCAGHRLIL